MLRYGVKLLAITICLMMLPLSSAFAGDRKVYPGSMCNVAGDATNYKYTNHEIYNNASSNLLVTCPVVRDNTLSGGDVPLSVQVRGYDGDAYDSISCYFENCDYGDSSGWCQTDTLGVSGSAATGDFYRSRTTFSAGHGTASTYVIECLIPTYSSIYSYTVEEQ